MGLNTINQDQFIGFLQVLQKRLKDLDQELKLPPKQRRLDREIEFDKRTVIQSINAIQRFKSQAEVRVSLVKNNLFGLETPKMLAEFLEELEIQSQQAQTEAGTPTEAQQPGSPAPVVEATPPVTPPVIPPVSEAKVQAPVQQPVSHEISREEKPHIPPAAPEQKPVVRTKIVETPVPSISERTPEPAPVTTVSTAPVKQPEPVIEPPTRTAEQVLEKPAPKAPEKKPEPAAVAPLHPAQVKVPIPGEEPPVTKVPKVVVEKPISTVQKVEEQVVEFPAAPEILPQQPRGDPEAPDLVFPTFPAETVIKGEEATLPAEPSVISQAPFNMPVVEREVPVEEPAAAPEDQGVLWNGTPRAGNIFKGQKAAYELQKYLSSGNYGETWKAAVVEATEEDFLGSYVALKITNPGLTVEEKQQFLAEVSVLEQLKNHKPDDLIRVNGRLLVPEILELVQDPPVPPGRTFFTKTLATGIPIDKLRRGRSRLPEPVALEIAAQFCRVLQALHEGVHASLVTFDAENILYDEEARRIFVTGWYPVNKGEQANFAGDLVAIAGELYQMVMGVPAPVPGSSRVLGEPVDRWNELDLGIQDILVRAFDALLSYLTAGELRKDLEWLGKWWNQPWWDSLSQLTDLFKRLPQDEQLTGKEQQELFLKTLRASEILEKVATRPENEAEAWAIELHKITNQLSKYKTGAYWLEKGQNAYRSKSWDFAEQNFSQALKDERYVLDATRWLQAVKAGRSKWPSKSARNEPEIASLLEGISLLHKGKYAEAAPIFDELSADEAGKEFAALAAEARLQQALQLIPGFTEKRQYKELADAYQNAIAYLHQLPRGYKDIFKHGFEDFDQKQREYASRYKRLYKLQERYAQLITARKGEFPDYYEKLRELFDEQPGDADLLRLGKEEIYRFLSKGKYAEGRALAALCLDYNCGTDPYIYQVWQYASQLERCWQAWSRGNGPAFRNALLNQAWPSDLWADLVLKVLDKTLELPGEYFAVEFLKEILTSSKIVLADPKAQERIANERDRMQSRIDTAFQEDEEEGTNLLVNLIGEHPYSLTLFNQAAAKVEMMLRNNNFSAALRVAQAASTQFSIRDLLEDKESVAQGLQLLRSFLQSATRILPLQKAWLGNGAVGLAQQLDLESPWGEGTHWSEDELVFLRDFLNSCFARLVKKDFLGWNLVLSKVDPEETLYQRLNDKRVELNLEFKNDVQNRLKEDAQLGLENLRALWMRYPLDAILEQVSLDAVDYDFLFQDEHAEKAYKLFNKLSGCSQPLKERIVLSAKHAQYYRIDPVDPEGVSKELLDKLLDSGKLNQLSQERTAFLEAVYLTWFKRALDRQDLAIGQAVYALLPKDKWAKAEVEALSSLRQIYSQTVQSLADRTSEALKKGEQIEQQPVGLAAKLMKNLQKQSDIDDALLEWNGLISELQTWMEKTKQSGWNEESYRLRSYFEKLTKQYARVELLTARKSSETNLVLIGELWKLALPGTPEDPQGEPRETPKASDANRLQWLLQMDKACQELLKTYPKDSQTKVWLGWQSRIQTELRKVQKP